VSVLVTVCLRHEPGMYVLLYTLSTYIASPFTACKMLVILVWVSYIPPLMKYACYAPSNHLWNLCVVYSSVPGIVEMDILF
jgi:hypothetical protein